MRLRPATHADLPRIYDVRHGTADNRLSDPTLVTDAEVAWYMDNAVFLVSEDEASLQGLTCANHQTGYLWALFVIDEAQGRGHGTALLAAALSRLKEAGHRQAFLSTDAGTRAEGFYRSKGWQPTGINMQGEIACEHGYESGTRDVTPSLKPMSPSRSHESIRRKRPETRTLASGLFRRELMTEVLSHRRVYDCETR